MTNTQIRNQSLLLLCCACAYSGVFSATQMAMISDAIVMHTNWFVLGFLLTQVSTTLLFIGCATGVITVILVEYFSKTWLVQKIRAIGLSNFPGPFQYWCYN